MADLCIAHFDHEDHCRLCTPQNVHEGTTVVCQHGRWEHPHSDGKTKHVLISSGANTRPPQPEPEPEVSE